MTTTAILFDLDDTLVVEEASVEEAFLATCEHARTEHGIDPKALTQTVRRTARQLWQAAPTISYCRTIGISSWEGLWARFLGDNPNLEALRAWAPDYRRGAWSNALLEHGIDNVRFAEHLADEFQRERRSRHIVFPDVEPTLQILRKNLRLGLVTNGAPALQREKIEGAGLGHYFESITVSGDTGIAKPDPGIFALALDKLGERPETTTMVGNSLKRDIAGARQAGLKAIWINRLGLDGRQDIQPDGQITRLDELLEELELDLF